MSLEIILKLIDQGVSVLFFLSVMFSIFKYMPDVLKEWANTNKELSELRHAAINSNTTGSQTLQLSNLMLELLNQVHSSQLAVEKYLIDRKRETVDERKL